jgi:folate-binding protein YgfZ
MLTSPLARPQTEAGAKLAEAHGWTVAQSYAGLESEHEAALLGAGLVDRSSVGRLKLTGDDCLDLLNRLTTNDLTPLTSPGQGTATVLTTPKGRILDLLVVLTVSDGLLLLTSPQNRRKVADWIDFYTIMDDVTVHDETEETAMVAVIGPGAAALLDGVTDERVSSLSRFDHVSIDVEGTEVRLVRTDFAGVAGYDLIAPAALGEELWGRLLEADPDIEPVGAEALEAVRVQHGIPACGKELTEERNPLEANLTEFISFNKICYIGQEVVARLDTYEKVQRHLVGLSWDEERGLGDGALFADGKRVGEITSSARVPGLSRTVGLGYVRKAQATPGVTLTMDSESGDLTATVEELPFRP